MAEYAKGQGKNLKVISKDKEKGTFVGKDLKEQTTYKNLKIKDFYFYDFC